ncbi:MAG: biotin/lipoyl-binding protein [Chloroflexi bacterium]|nr:biotin/lipoyl-binding protein [Chloroflexota bacterium]
MNLDEELAIEVSPWRGRLITLGVLMGLAIVVGIVVYAFFIREESESLRPTEDLVVGRATINANLIISGVAEAQLESDLTFRTSGRIESINVAIGDVVREGDVLAALESKALDNAVASAQAGLGASRARLANLLEGATDAELANAAQTVAQAENGLANATRDLEDLLDGPSQTQITADVQAVAAAEGALNDALRARQDLIDGPTSVQITNANQAVVSAQTALDQAMRARQELLDGPTETQLAQAAQGVAGAQANLNATQRAHQDLLDGPTAAQSAAAEQAVAAAEASLASAEASLDRVTSGPDAAALAAAESQVAAAEQGLTSATAAQQSALSNVDTAEASLLAAIGAYCAEVVFSFLCSSPDEVPLTGVEIDDLLADLVDPVTPFMLLPEINGVLQANLAYLSALNGVATANGAVVSAQASLAAARANLTVLRDGPSVEDVAAAEAAVTAAQEGLTLAQINLDELLDGPSADDIANSQDAVLTAQAGLDAAVASQNDLLDGAEANDIAQADGGVLTARAALDAAITGQEDLLAGADGDDFARADDSIRSARAALNAAQSRLADLLDEPGFVDVDRAEDTQRVGEAAVDAARAVLAEVERGARDTQIEQERQGVRSAELAVEAALIRLEESQIISPFNGTVAAVNLTLGEFASSAAALPPIVLLTPNLVVLSMAIGETDYPQVKLDQAGIALFDALPGRPFPFRVTEIGLAPTVTQGVVTYPITGAIVIPPDSPRPAPGMSANGQIITDSLPDVIAVPPRAIRRSGGDQVVDVRRDGEVVEQIIVTGASDNNNVQILEGLSEGDTIVLPALIGGAQADDAPDPTLPAGIR